MLNYLGACENFAVLAGVKWECTFEFGDEVTGEAEPLDGMTFSGRVVANDTTYEMTLVRSEAHAEGNVVQVVIPPLPEGRWRYEVYAVAETGYKGRLLYGFVSAVGIEDWDDEATYASRTLAIRLPGDATKPLRAEWKASTAAVLAAKQATEAAKEVSQLNTSVQNALELAQDATEKLEEVDGKLEDVNEVLNNAQSAAENLGNMIDNLPEAYIPTIGENGNWWLNGVDSGKTAIGVDGRDGDELLRVKVNSVADIPAEGDGTTVYYVPNGSGSYDCYVWTWADATKTEGSWAKANESVSVPTPVASVSVSGTIKLGSSTIVEKGAWVGVNNRGQAGVLPATASAYGTVKIATSHTIEGGQLVGYNANGQLVASALPVATLGSYGMVKLGSRCSVTEDIPFRLSIATASNGALCNNMVRNGALQHRRRAQWTPLAEQHMPWMDTATMAETEYDYYLGLHTSEQFSQSETRGLTLLPATATRVGGVKVNGNGDTVYTKEQADALLASINSAIAEVRDRAEHSVYANETLMGIRVMTVSAYEALPSLEAKTMYYVIPD